MQGRFLLAADIGGTFSRFALFRLGTGLESASLSGQLFLELVPDSKIKIATKDSTSFTGLLERLLSEKTPGGYTLLPSGPRPGYEILVAAMAVPGPVEKGRCIAANIPWPLDKRDIEAVLGVPASLLNDFAAQGHACLFPEILGLHTVRPGESKGTSLSAVIGAGTGLGSALILPGHGAHSKFILAGQKNATAERIALPPELLDNQASCAISALEFLHGRVLPSEGGHAVFGFRGDAEAAFEAFMRRLTGRQEVIGDMAVTGHGLAALYAFHTGADRLLDPSDVTPLIHNSPITLEWFARFYGRACRNFVLTTLSLGGVYLSGGVLSHVPGLLGHPAFAEEFLFSETKDYLLREVPVCWISNQDSGLWGTAVYGLKLVK